MGRPRRLDGPGAWHHVMNRGIARRTTFEGPPDIDAFQEAVLDATRGGWLQVHVFSVMENHFHLLVRTERGTVSEGMRRVESAYVRVFNRVRGRDGPLFRGRFCSRPVTSEAYWYAVLRYIDRNPVAAGLAQFPTDYPHGSAWWYSRPSGPEWLCRKVVEEVVRLDAGRTEFDPRDYLGFSAAGEMDWQRSLIERRMRRTHRVEDPLDQLMSATRRGFADWMHDAARMADGTGVGIEIASPEAVLAALDGAGATKTPEVLDSLRVGLLRTGAGLTESEIARRLGRSRHWVRSTVVRHRSRLLDRSDYENAAEAALRSALDRTVGRRVRAGAIPMPDTPVSDTGVSPTGV